jgi:hypothetical protein
MQFVSKSRESLDTLAQALLSEVAEGCTLADLMEGGSLLVAFFGVLGASSIEAPKREVHCGTKARRRFLGRI